jgi:hypothetical protein
VVPLVGAGFVPPPEVVFVVLEPFIIFEYLIN